MFIPKTAEYAIRCMAQIALLPWESSISAAELSQLVGVPQDYLSKILRKLVTAGLLVGEKGHRGGFKLTSPPSTISYLKILDATGFAFNPDHCAFGWGNCNADSPCPLHKTFSQLSNQFFQWASTTTLADVDQATHIATRTGYRSAQKPSRTRTAKAKSRKKKKKPAS